MVNTKISFRELVNLLLTSAPRQRSLLLRRIRKEINRRQILQVKR